MRTTPDQPLVSHSQILCTVVVALIQYLFLCTFCWMLSEGIMLYLLVVRVFGSATKRWYFLLFLGWGKLLLKPLVGQEGLGTRLLWPHLSCPTAIHQVLLPDWLYYTHAHAKYGRYQWCDSNYYFYMHRCSTSCSCYFSWITIWRLQNRSLVCIVNFATLQTFTGQGLSKCFFPKSFDYEFDSSHND